MSPQRQGAGFSQNTELPQLNPEIRPQLTFEECITNEEMELLTAYCFGTQKYPGKFHKLSNGEKVAFPPWDRLTLAVQQFEEAGFNFGGIESKPATMWKVEPFARAQESDRDRVDEIMKDLIGWKVPKLEKYYEKWEEHLEKIEFNLDTNGVSAPISVDAGRTLNIRSLVTMKKGEEPVGQPNSVPEKEVDPLLTRVKNAQSKKLAGLDNETLIAETNAKAGKKEGIGAAVAKLNEKEKVADK